MKFLMVVALVVLAALAFCWRPATILGVTGTHWRTPLVVAV
jgi:hypothetical protein